MASDRLVLIQQELRGIDRRVRIVKQLVAQEIDSTAAAEHSPEEDIEHGKQQQDQDRVEEAPGP